MQRMQLSDTEKKMVARLRRKQVQMVRARWLILLTGIRRHYQTGQLILNGIWSFTGSTSNLYF